MRKRIYSHGEETDKAAARRILAFYRRKNAERSARLARQRAVAIRNLRAANRAQRMRAGVVMLD
jgi:hypothetical protein